ncbi:MAG: hypothetical protein HY542_01135 [Deltaproteobacteria bacterium]|nr:hypothetical protein [Deltaproteobacteria bacterium]
MPSFLLDQDSDLDLTGNKINLVTGLQEIQQHMSVRFRLFRGEWFLDQELGVPWFEDVLKKRPNFAVVAEVLKSVITDTPGHVELLEFEIDYDQQNRTMTLKFKDLTDPGIVNFNEEIVL